MKYSIREISNQDEEMLLKIGKFRFQLWNEETKVNHDMFPTGIWLEKIDQTCRHWIVVNEETQELIGVARLSLHETLEDNPDGYLWIKHNMEHRVPAPVGHLCKLSVAKTARGYGIGRKLSEIRIEAARDVGAKSIIVTASPQNARLLASLGFQDTGIREIFPNRPQFEFYAMDYVFE